MEISNGVFFDEVLSHIRAGKSVRINAKGRSMLPLIRDRKDTITLEPLSPDSIRRGNIVLADVGDKNFVLHRIVSVEGDRVILRGDGNPYGREYCSWECVLAEATAIESKGKLLTKESLRWKCIQYMWPRHGFVRRVLLYIIRRL